MKRETHILHLFALPIAILLSASCSSVPSDSKHRVIKSDIGTVSFNLPSNPETLSEHFDLKDYHTHSTYGYGEYRFYDHVATTIQVYIADREATAKLWPDKRQVHAIDQTVADGTYVTLFAMEDDGADMRASVPVGTASITFYVSGDSKDSSDAYLKSILQSLHVRRSFFYLDCL